MLNYEELKPVVEMMARKYHLKAHMEYEDMRQDIWIFCYERNFDNIKFATVSIKNKCIDISRKSWRNDNMRDYSDPDCVFASFSDKKDFTEDIAMESVVDSLTGDEYVFAVSSAYLAKNMISLEDRFMKIYENLPDDRKSIIENWDKRFTDDVIFKAILGIKTGSNSGTARKIKWTIYNEMRKNGITIDKYEKAFA